jgi:hypothetical protein
VVVSFGTASVSERPGKGAKSHGRRPGLTTAGWGAIARPLAAPDEDLCGEMDIGFAGK